jgi:DNA invertase Pin-like site-specific DNA recombinase
MKKKIKVPALIYARTSVNDKEVNLVEQITQCDDYCKSNGLKVVDAIFEVSSTIEDQRDNMKYLIEQIKSGTIKAVVVTSADRLTRNKEEAIRLNATLEESGVTLHIIDGGPLLLETAVKDITQLHNKIMSEEVKRGIAGAKRKKGVAKK